MRKLQLLFLTTLLCISGIAQKNPERWLFEAGGPPAGKAWEEIPMIPGEQYSDFLELDWDSLNMQFTGNWPYGQSFSVHSSPTGDTVFFGQGAGVTVMDASDPYNPVKLGEVRARALVDHSYYDAANRLLYLAAYFSGVEIWDVSDFTQPTRLSRIPLNSYPRGGIFARNGFLYIVTVADGVHIADVSNPSNPTLISHQAISGSLVWTSSLDGDYLYAVLGTSGVRILDISDPYNPFIAEVLGGNTSFLKVIDGIGYMLCTDFGLCLYDFTDLGNISQYSELPIDGYPYRLTVSGDHVYIANSTSNNGGGINAVDVSDFENPVLLTTIDPPETYISGSGEVVAATGNSSGLLLVDISDPANPIYASEINTAWGMVDVHGAGDYAYAGSNGFRVFDMSDPSYPVQVGFEESKGEIIRTSGDVAILIPQSMTANNKVTAIDISDPTNPAYLDHYTAPAMTYDLAFRDQYAYIACWWDGFRVVDFSDPANLSIVSHNFGWTNGSPPGEEWCYVQSLDVYGNYLYVLDYGPFEEDDTKGLYIWDISVPDDPELIHRWPDAISRGHDIKAWGEYVYISDKDGGLEIVNVSDPYAPFTEGYIGLPDVAWGMDLSWPYAYVSQYILGGVHIVNVMDPSDPEIYAYYQRSGCFALGVTAWNNYALVADGPAGMQVYDFLLATGTEEDIRNAADKLMIFPNPTSGQLGIKSDIELNGTYSITIFDLTGRKVFDTNKLVNGRVISLNISVPGGIYFVHLVGNGVTRSAKLLVE